MSALCWIVFAVAVFVGSALCLGVMAFNAELESDDGEITPRNDPDTPRRIRLHLNERNSAWNPTTTARW